MKANWGRTKVTKSRGNLSHNEIEDARTKSEIVERYHVENKVEKGYRAEQFDVPHIKVIQWGI